MLKNNNREVIQRISNRSLRQNRTRNIFVILAIVLTTFMFTTVFSIGFSLLKNARVMLLREQGSKTSITLEQPTKEQIAQAKETKHLCAAGIRIKTGVAEIKGKEQSIRLDYFDETEFEENYTPAISDSKGAYPKAQDEIMLSADALENLGIKDPKAGMKISLLVNGQEQNFRLSGYFTDYALLGKGFQGLVSEAYVKALGLSATKDGTLCLSAKEGKQAELIDELEKGVSLREGQKFDSSYDLQEENDDTAVGTVVAVGFVGLIIIVSGYLLIYNVMYISITKDIRFYGMLKTIGTSPSQIKRIVKLQATRLSLIGIPIGILLSTLTSFLVVPYSLKMFADGMNSIMPTDISFHPLIYIGTIVFAIMTVAISCRKPAKFAGKVSPVEALKYNGRNKEKIKAKNSTNGGRLYKMAFRNVFREKKRAVLVFASLFMGTMAFLSVNTFFGSLKLQNYVDFYLPDDYTIYTDFDEEEDGVSEAMDLAKEIEAIDGVENVSVNLSSDSFLAFDKDIFLPFLQYRSPNEAEVEEMIAFYENPVNEEAAYSAPVVAVSTQMIERYNKKAHHKINIERFEKGEECLIGFVSTQEESDSILGKKITVTDKKSGKSKTLEIGSCPTQEEDHGINVGYFWMKAGAPEIILISEKALYDFCDKPDVNNIIVNCNPKSESTVTSKIKQMVKGNPCIVQTEIKSETIADFKNSITSMNILGGGASLVLVIIGMINFVNVMLTGVYTRRGELAVMESVGMTKKQVKKMLIYEGAYYGMISIGLIFTLGNALMYLIANMAQNIADYAVFYYPLAGMIGMSVAILVICMLVPVVVYRILAKESVTERLRRED